MVLRPCIFRTLFDVPQYLLELGAQGERLENVDYQIVGNEKRPFDDRLEARRALEEISR